MPCLHEQMYSAHSHCCEATLHIATQRRLVARGATRGASPFGRTRHKKNEQLSLLVFKTLCHTLTDYRTIVDGFYKVVEFVEWLKEYYPDKA